MQYCFLAITFKWVHPHPVTFFRTHMQTLSRFHVYVVVFFLGALCFFVGQGMWRVVTSCHENYDLLNKNSLCNASIILNSDRSEWQYQPLRDALMQKIAFLQANGKVIHMSIFFRDLKNGPRFGIQEYDDFHTASLLKVPVMLAILQAADGDSSLLDTQLLSPATLPPISNVDTSDDALKPGTSYTIRELLRRMIVYSDNDAANMLIEKINADPQPVNSNTFLDLGMINMMSGKMDKLSMLTYSNLFTVLYNTAYLSDELSQFALELLTKSTYKEGLVAGVPSTVRVAHKFGYYEVEGEAQLHDCGIVYHRSTPYVLCVMTDGTSIKDEAASIAEISKQVYEAVDAMDE